MINKIITRDGKQYRLELNINKDTRLVSGYDSENDTSDWTDAYEHVSKNGEKHYYTYSQSKWAGTNNQIDLVSKEKMIEIIDCVHDWQVTNAGSLFFGKVEQL